MRKLISLTLLLFSQLSMASGAPKYCAAIRGNGELVPAQWSAMSRLVEELGMPEATAGGSSASVTMFFLESISQSKVLKNETDPVIKKKKQALLLKTLPVYIATLSKVEQADNALEFLNQLKQEKSILSQGLIAATKGARNFDKIKKALVEYGPLLNPEILKNFRRNFNVTRSETMEAISVFGSFNAKTDDKLFFRPGLIDFKQFALVLGKIGDFYAGNTTPQVTQLIKDFLNNCSENAYRQVWPNEQHQQCKDQFAQAVVQYVLESKKNPQLSTQVFTSIGQGISSFPTTSLLVGSAFEDYDFVKNEYNQFNQEIDYKDFSIDFEDLRFGYWGPSRSSLKKIKSQLLSKYSEDEKSKKFLSLGKGTWFDVLSTSPAEPGLANFQRITHSTNQTQVGQEVAKSFEKRWSGLEYKKNMISAGGWSDLHPSLVLKAHGCENVVYVTRTDGETIFGQQVFIRLTGLKSQISFWERLADSNKEGWSVKGTSAEDTPWNDLYNISNPKSSFNTSIKESDAVYCTNWNDFKVLEGQPLELIVDAYTAPVLLQKDAPQQLQVNPHQLGHSSFIPGCRIK